MKILILGATGSIGKQAIEVIDKNELVGITFNKNILEAKKIIKKFGLTEYYSPEYKDFSTCDSIEDIIKKTNPTIVLNAIVGYAGLEYSYLVIKNKINLALANKETLVMAGKFINELSKKNKITIYPVDSEHAALFELININNRKVKKIYITCSGGSAYNLSKKELSEKTFDEIIKHPKWNMGYKISVDSATLINKCFEIVEAFWLFGIKNIEAIYHPQALVHSMVEFIDNSIFSQMAITDMKLPIQLAINKFEKKDSIIKPMVLDNVVLSFDKIDQKKYIPLKWANDIIEDTNNSLGTIINVANEIAIEKFKNKEIRFDEIIAFIEKQIKKYNKYKINKISDIFYLIDKMKVEI